jgi:hypothetical protein
LDEEKEVEVREGEEAGSVLDVAVAHELSTRQGLVGRGFERLDDLTDHPHWAAAVELDQAGEQQAAGG